MIQILYLIIFISSFLISQEDPCSLSDNTIYLNSSEVWYNTTFDIGGFQWNIDGGTVLGASGGDAETAGFTVSAGASTVLGFSFTGSFISSGCGILTILSLDGDVTGLSGIIFSNNTGQQINVNYYCDDIDGDGLCIDDDNCPYDLLNDYDADGLCGCTIDNCENIENIDICPFDSDNDVDNDGLCADQDSCPNDPLNDDDNDGICYAEDICPNDPLNDVDGDGICDSDDSCVGQYDICGICDGDHTSCSQEADHLLLSRVAVSPNNSEMVQIINPTNLDINLNEDGPSGYYLTDGASPHPTEPEFYYNLPNIQEMGNAWSLQPYDFFMEFPENTIIESGDTLTIAIHDEESFSAYYGFEADISLNTLFPNMYYDMAVENGAGFSIIEDQGESLVLFKWNGLSNTVVDVDYFLWGTDYYAVDKSSISFSGNVSQQLGDCFLDCNGIEILNSDNPDPVGYCNLLVDLNNDSCIEDCSIEALSFFENIDNFCDDCLLYSSILEEDTCGLYWSSFWLTVNDMGYYPDISKNSQMYIGEIESNIDPTAPEHYSYFRVSEIEYGEYYFLGNGITGHNETSENFQLSWTYDKNPETDFNYGCMNSGYDNYDSSATIDYNSCTNFTSTIQGILNGDVIIDENQPSAVSISGKMVSFTQTSGPWIIKIVDDDGYEIEVIGYWDIHNSIIDYLIDAYNYTNYVVSISGSLGMYNNKYQIEIFNASQIDDYIQYYTQGQFIEDDQIIKAEIVVAPYVIIPSIGERINFMYSFPSESRVIIRIFSLDGRFITSLVDRYYDTGGIVIRGEDYSSWDGMDHLGQIVNPGTYLIHIEASNFITAKTSNDVAPIVVGVSY